MIPKFIATVFFLFFYTLVIAQNKTVIQFQHKVGDQELQLFSKTYFNYWNEPFIVNKFKYYITALEIEFENGKQRFYWQKKYHLVDEAEPASKKIEINSIFQNIKAIHFVLGVDSIVNTTGAHTGDLDPMKSMFWTWNTGYIYAKLEGTSDSSKAQAHSFSYHIGGYKTNENAVKKISLPIVERATNNLSEIIIDADISTWFYGMNNIKISSQPICHQPGKLALSIADNYSKMFSIKSIK
jgi:hypothetical protein